MNTDLERSVRLLEDALSTPRSTPTKTTFKATPRTQKRKIFSNVSMTVTDEEIRKYLNQEYDLPDDDFTTTETSMWGAANQSGTPWTNTINNLHLEFAEILQNNSGGTEILEVAADAARCCSDVLTVIQNFKLKSFISEIPEEKMIENERNNWRLLFVLYQDRLQKESYDENYTGTSEKLCIECLFKRDGLVRESQLIIDWLERNAFERDDPILHHNDWTSGWENTLHQLLAPDVIAIGSNVPIVGSLHPDAPHFEGVSLHHLDAENDKKLCRRVFTEIRCGKLEAAQEVSEWWIIKSRFLA